MYEKMTNLLKDLVDRNSTFMLSFIFTDAFFISLMFLVYELPIGAVMGLCAGAGAIISGIIMAKATGVPGVEGNESLAGKLCYFPVDMFSIRKAQYQMAFKITGIQLIVLAVPLIVMCFHFKWQNALTALFSTAVSMLLIAAFNIEINLISYKRK